jgi:hypothetical protein
LARIGDKKSDERAATDHIFAARDARDRVSMRDVWE